MVFSDYARYYNLLYADKNYQGEVEYVKNLFQKYADNKVKTILNLGCGTGLHDAEFAKHNFQITGIDYSQEMINNANQLAKEKNLTGNLNFICSDIRNLELKSRFDAVTALFHVMSYQTSNEDVNATFETVKKHLLPGGIFVFDFWYGPAVLTTKPELRIKRMEDSSIQVTRIAEPVIHYNENVVDVNYEVHIMDRETKQFKIVNEKHSMRYFFLPEILTYAGHYGFEVMSAGEWVSGKKLSSETWGCCVVLKLVK